MIVLSTVYADTCTVCMHILCVLCVMMIFVYPAGGLYSYMYFLFGLFI